MKMKYLLGIATFMLLFSIQGFAQSEAGSEKMTPERKSEIMSERLAQKLELTDIQKQKVQALFLKDQRRKEQAKVDRVQKREEFRTALKAILTPDQMEKYNHMIEERKHNKMHQRKRPDRPEKKNIQEER